jgi:hypothetical protein
MSRDSLNKITTEFKCEVEKLHKIYDIVKTQLKQEYSEGKISKRLYHNDLIAISNMVKHDNKNLAGASAGLNSLKHKNFCLHNFQQIEFQFQGLLVDIMERRRLLLKRMGDPQKIVLQISHPRKRC